MSIGLACTFALPGATAVAQAALSSAPGLFTRVPNPGGPEGVAVAEDGTVYVGTLNGAGGDRRAPSKVFAHSPTGTVLRSYQIAGQDLSRTHGVTGIALDAGGDLYIGDLAPPRVLRLDPRTGRQTTYATLRDVKPCYAGGTAGDCSAGLRDFPAWPDYLAFTADGGLYVTDSLQSLIWRIPKGGGQGQVFFTDSRLQTLIGDPAFGPSGMTLAPDGHTLVFSTVEGPLGNGDLTAGRIWTLPILPDGLPGALRQFWASRSIDAPDGMAFGRSGRLYVDLSGIDQVAVISPTGQTLERTPPNLLVNELAPFPLDSPLGMAFQGQRLLIANSSFLLGIPISWAVLTLAAGEPGVPIVHPQLNPRPIGPHR